MEKYNFKSLKNESLKYDWIKAYVLQTEILKCNNKIMQMKNEKTMINLNLSIILLNTWSRKKWFKSNL